MKKYRDLTKNIGLFTLSSFGSKIIAFLLVPLYTRYLTTVDYGTMDLMMTTVSLLIPVLTINIQDAILRFCLDENYDSVEVFNQGLRINLIASLVFGVIIVLIKSFGILNLPDLYVFYMYVSFACGAFHNAMQMYFKSINKVNLIVISSLLQTCILCVSNILLLVVFELGVEGYLISLIISNIIPIIYLSIAGQIFKHKVFARKSELTKSMIRYSLPLVLNSVSWWINNASDRYILTYMSGLAANGLYSVAYKIPTILSTIQLVFYNAWSISAIKEFDPNDEDGFMGNTFSMYSWLSIMFCSLIILINIPLSKLLYSNDFFEAWVFVPFLLVGTVFNGLSLFEGCIFTALRQTNKVTVTTLIGAGVNTFCNFVFIYFFGALGAAIATLLGYFVTYILRVIILNKSVHMKINWNIQISSYILLIIQATVALQKDLIIVQIIILVLLVFINKDMLKLILYKLKSFISHKY